MAEFSKLCDRMTMMERGERAQRSAGAHDAEVVREAISGATRFATPSARVADAAALSGARLCVRSCGGGGGRGGGGELGGKRRRGHPRPRREERGRIRGARGGRCGLELRRKGALHGGTPEDESLEVARVRPRAATAEGVAAPLAAAAAAGSRQRGAAAQLVHGRAREGGTEADDPSSCAPGGVINLFEAQLVDEGSEEIRRLSARPAEDGGEDVLCSEKGNG